MMPFWRLRSGGTIVDSPRKSPFSRKRDVASTPAMPGASPRRFVSKARLMMSNPILLVPGQAERRALSRIGRRAFVRFMGLALLAVPALSACSDPVDNERDGVVHITINGLQPGADNAGRVIITGEGIEEIDEVIPAALTEIEISVEAGTYHVTYEPPSGYAMASIPNNENDFDVTVVAGETTEISRTIEVATGTLNISVTGLSAGAATGGSASVLRTDLSGQTPVVVPVATNGSATTSVVPGTYEVTYTPPAGHTLASGETGVESHTIASGGSATATFAVEVLAATGTLRVQVNGLTGSATSGGSVQITRTGQPQIDQAVPVAGTLDLVVGVGTYNVQYFPPSGFALAAGQTNPQSVSVTQGTTTSATFTVTPSAGPTGIVFHSDWSTALGNTQAALLDISKPVPWAIAIGSGWGNAPDSQAAIAPNPGGFPTQNVFRVVIPFGGTEHGTARIIRTDDIPVPANGQSLYYRWYASVNLPDPLPAGFDALWHPWQDGQASSGSNWEWEVVGRTVGDNIPAGKWRSRMYLKGRSTHRRFFVDLDLNTVYRFELRVLRISDTEFDVETRVYLGDSTTPLFDTDDFMSIDGGGTHLGSAGITAPFVDPNNLNGLNMGQNDVMQGMVAVGKDILFGYQAGVAVSNSDWIGPYANGK